MFLLTVLPIKFCWYSNFSLYSLNSCSFFVGWLRFRYWYDPRHSFGKYSIEILMTHSVQNLQPSTELDYKSVPALPESLHLRLFLKGPLSLRCRKSPFPESHQVLNWKHQQMDNLSFPLGGSQWLTMLQGFRYLLQCLSNSW